jgi:hypothetical protein
MAVPFEPSANEVLFFWESVLYFAEQHVLNVT